MSVLFYIQLNKISYNILYMNKLHLIFRKNGKQVFGKYKVFCDILKRH